MEEITEQAIHIRLGTRLVTDPQTFLSDLLYGFAITIHRSQSSEYPLAIIPVHESQRAMLTRELLYTALICRKQMGVLIGSRRTFAQAISNSQSHRYTNLHTLLSPSKTLLNIKQAA